MELLTTNVMDATGLDPAIAKAAIGQVLLFLRGEAPLGHVAEFIDKMPGAHEAVEAAAAHGDGGVTAAIEGMTSFMGRGRADTNILAGRLVDLGLDETQIKRTREPNTDAGRSGGGRRRRREDQGDTACPRRTLRPEGRRDARGTRRK